MLVPKKPEAIPANELFQEEQPLDTSSLFQTSIEPDSLFSASAPTNEGEGLSRFRSGFNSFAQRAGKALLEDLPKFAVIAQNLTLPGLTAAASQGRAFQPEEDPLYKFGEAVGEAIEEMFPENQEFQDEYLARIIPAALGDLTAAVAAGLPTAGGGALLVGTSTISSQEYEQAIEETNGDKEKAFQAFLFNLPFGAVDAIPVGKFMRRLDTATGGGVKELLGKSFKGGIEELITESIQTAGTNIVAQNTYDEQRKMWDGVRETAEAGGVVGFVLNAVGLSTKRIISGTSDVNTAQEAHNVNEEVNEEAELDVEDFIRPEHESRRIEGQPISEDFGFRDPDAQFQEDGDSFLPVPTTRLPDSSDDAGNQQYDEEAPRTQTFEVNPDDELNSFQRFFQRWLSPRGLMTEETFEAIKQGNALKRAEVFESEQRTQTLYSAIRENMPDVQFRHGRPNLSQAQEAGLNALLRGDRSTLPQEAGILPEPVIEAAQEMRRHIDRMSNQLLEEGLVGGPLGERIASNLGVYIHRSYRAITDGPRWARSVPVEVRNKAEAFIRQRYQDTEGRVPTPREVNNIIDSLLYNQDAQRSLLLDTQFGGVDLTLLRTRTAVPAPIRALLGEIEAPIANYLNTAERLADLVNDQRTLTRVAELGMGQIFFQEGEFFRPSGYNQVIDSLGDPALNPLHGMMTHPEILKSMKEIYGKNKPLGRLHKAYLKLNGLAKLSKTVLSPITHARNTLGGSVFLLANGHNPLRLTEPRQVIRNLREKGANTRKRRYVELDLMDQSIAGSELDAVYREMRLEDGIPMMENFEFFRPDGPMADLYNRTIGRGIEASIKLYQAEDNLIRLSMFEKELGRYRQALDPNGTWSADEVRALEEQVAGMIRDTYPNYARVPESIRRLRRNVLVGPFVSFPYEVIRTTINTARLARGETRSSNPAIRALGLRRGLGLMTAIASPIAVGAASAALSGITEETEDDIERMAPHWDQNTPKYYLSKENGKVRYINLGYITPYSVITDPVQAMLFGHEDSVHGRFLEGLRKFGRSFLGVELTTQALDEIRRNEKANGTWVTNPVNPTGTKFADYFAHLWDAFEPGIITSTVTKPLERGAAFKPEEEALAMLTGFRITELDVGRSLTFKARDFNRNRRNARSIASSVIRKDGSSIDERVRAAGVANEVYEAEWNNLQRLYESSLRLGLTQDEVDGILDGAGVGKKLRRDLALQTFTPLEIDLLPEE